MLAHPAGLQFPAEPSFHTFGGKVVEVFDVSQEIEEAPAVSNPGLLTVQADKLFRPGIVFLGMGLPNVYMAHVYGEKSVKVVAAKSLYREELRVVESHGKVQSGLFFIAKNLTEEEINAVKAKSYASEGSFSVTCLNATVGILASIGFELPGIRLADYRFPHAFLSDILRNGLKPKLNGRDVEFALVKTTKMSLDDYYNSIISATATTPVRHLNRALDCSTKRRERKKASDEITAANEAKLEQLISSYPSGGPTYTVFVSETSSLGEFFRNVWGTHVIYKLQLSDQSEFIAKLQELLPTTLKEFDRPEIDFATKIKKNILFCESVVDLIRSHMTKSFDRHDGFNQFNLLHLLTPEIEGTEHKYNFVVTSQEMIVISNSICYGFIDWILSKHVLISGYSHDVRFAGELWKDEHDVIHLNNNSGTYRPNAEQLSRVVELAHVLFPDLKVVACDGDLPFEETEQSEPIPEAATPASADEDASDSFWNAFGFIKRELLPMEEEVKEVRQALALSRSFRALKTNPEYLKKLGEEDQKLDANTN